jgi:hypothetical protein
MELRWVLPWGLFSTTPGALVALLTLLFRRVGW